MKSFLFALCITMAFAATFQVRAADEIPATAPAADNKKSILAVLPFLGGDEKEKKLAERMRFAVSQKIINDAHFAAGAAKLERLDNVQVEQTISALGIPWEAGGPKGPGTLPDDDDLQKLLSTLGADQAIAGIIKARTLTLMLYQAGKLVRSASVDIPPDKESPKLAVEKILGELTGAAFAHIRDVEADHSDAAAERRFAARPNLVSDPGFEQAATDKMRTASTWDAILGSDHYAPPLITAEEARGLGADRVAVVQKSLADPGAGAGGHCLMMRMSKNVAENNGLACVSTWIPVEAGKKYRFTCQYYSQGPTARLFLKGFAYKPDQYGGGAAKNDPEAVRREFYRAQVAPREKNRGFELIEMDFTPSSLKTSDPKIEWMRVDLYIYLHEGTVFFDDITMKKLDE